MIFPELEACREEVLWWEICSLLHDVGKLSGLFLKYRQEWQFIENGYGEDPHDNGWLDRDPLLIGARPHPIKKEFERAILDTPRGVVSIIRSIHKHTKPEWPLEKLLNYGDGVDSMTDRNNPLFGCEQTNGTRPFQPVPQFRSNVFGYEGTGPVTGEELDGHRKELYDAMEPILREALADRPNLAPMKQCHYLRMRELMEAHFERGLSDTTRPNNDTSLWEHVYSVASITKALHIQELMTGKPISGFTDVRFRVWGFGFDALRFLSNAHKIGDLLGRRKILETIFDHALKLIEFEVPFGNRVYQDENCILFLCPAVDDSYYSKLEAEINRIALEVSGSEILPKFTLSPAVMSLTQIAARIEDLRIKNLTPVTKGVGQLAEGFAQNWGGARESICAICQIRPAKDRNENRRICKTCLKRRSGHTLGLEDRNYQTRYLHEIADGKGRVAMIVAKFGLREWLDGLMVRTLLITEPEGIEKTFTAIQHISEIKEDAPERRVLAGYQRYHWNQMLADFKELRDPKDESTDKLFLYARPIVGSRLNRDKKRANETWDAWFGEEREQVHTFLNSRRSVADELNLVCGKTPTPSTILDVWETTEEFFEGFRKSADGAILGLPVRLREYRHGRDKPDWLNYSAETEIEIDGRQYEAAFDRDAFVHYVENLPADAPNGERVAPCRFIVTSPDLLLLLVPADQAVRISTAIRTEYMQRFGKVHGRLPLSIGNIFFQQHLPMFSVLDAARRMEQNFRRLHEGYWTRAPFQPSEMPNMELGYGGLDYHHPYAITAEPLPEKATYFHTIAGPIVHMRDAVGEEVLTRPNWFDAEFLGASADRLRLHIDSPPEFEPDPAKWQQIAPEAWKKRIERSGDIPTGPILLDDLPRMTAFWNLLRTSGATDAGVRNLEYLLANRKIAWKEANGADAEGEIAKLAAPLVARFLPTAAQREVIAMIQSGLFFRTLNLYLRILKERLDQ